MADMLVLVLVTRPAGPTARLVDDVTRDVMTTGRAGPGQQTALLDLHKGQDGQLRRD